MSSSQALVWSLVVSLAASGCTVVSEVPVGLARAGSTFEANARLVVTLRDGTRIHQRYIESDAETLVVGEVQRMTRGLDRENDPADKRAVRTRIPWQDVERIELEEYSTWRTTLIILLPILLLGGLAGVALGPGFPPPP